MPQARWLTCLACGKASGAARCRDGVGRGEAAEERGGHGGHAGAAGAPESGHLADRTDPARPGSIFYAERIVVIRAADVPGEPGLTDSGAEFFPYQPCAARVWEL